MADLIIDTHALIVSDDCSRYPHSPLGGQTSAWSRERPLTAEQLAAAMDEAGISKAVLLQSSTTYGFDNNYLADAVAAHKPRFCGAFSVDILEERAPEQMKYWVGRGLSNMRIFTHGSTMQAAWLAVDDRRTWPAWACACDLGIPISTNAADLLQVRRVLERYPQLTLILEHVTRPQIAQGPPYPGLGDLLALACHENFYLRITPRTFMASAAGKATPESYIATLIKVFGAERIMWGSYFPPAQAALPEIVARTLAVLAGCMEDDRQAILSGTALKLFPELR